jgi:4-amino-4-deoxy-L-arabinose transferase-like glycosyltransferase
LGVLTDTHPDGVQVFIYYWIQLFGTTEWIIKLPFLLMGIAAIFYFYKLGKLWYNESIRLFGAAFMAGTQYMIIYSLMARPYVSGLLLTLLMVYYWSKMIKESQVKFIRNTILFVLFGTISTYNHHFSLFFTGLVLLVGLFYIPKEKIKIYLLSGLIIGLLYLPLLSIFFLQLGKGGVGEWLRAPSNDWLIQFIYFAFNYSLLVIILLISIVLL